MKLAVTLRAWFIVTVQLAAEPLQAPLQPVNVEPSLGVALSVTRCASQKDFVHSLPQSIPLGFDSTVPVPLPDLLTRSSYSLMATLAGPPEAETAAPWAPPLSALAAVRPPLSGLMKLVSTPLPSRFARPIELSPKSVQLMY